MHRGAYQIRAILSRARYASYLDGVPIRFRLAELLRARGVTPYRLAKDTGLAFSTVYRMTRARPGVIAWETLERICAYLDCEPGDLVARTASKSRRRP